MDDHEVEDLARLLPPLLRSLEALGFVSRYLYPPELGAVLDTVGAPDAELRGVYDGLSPWRGDLADIRAAIDEAARQALTGFETLRVAVAAGGDMGQVYRALRALPRAQEALYPLAAGLPPISRFFLPPERREDEALLARLSKAPQRPDTGVIHVGEQPGERGGLSLYIPEDDIGDRPRPLIVALHGGAGSGRSFLWSWLRDARAAGAILAAPTAIGDTWALMGPDRDSPNLARMVEAICARWRVDPARILLTGMSDGGTFAYVSGLEPGSPFTHLAPIAAAFHPMLAGMADPGRVQGLPVHIAHGALDWMFSVDMAREARDALAAAGAAVTYRELPDLSHTYPRELNAEILAWLDATAGQASPDQASS
ncbi:alpha/beta hydrolase [Phenylobacterium soli]|uniref:Phospholipase n=1 Tax=Phenylobacterium soli TaxID=2170551 RepID=A0A328ANX5_9CAUL|nr:phospholipase [Phenylobacterium soli]RAK56065.1 phospholipase [Phenylobacterium soli]